MSNKNFISSVFMVAGCAMGAGCLAMPMLAAGPNFIFSSISLILAGILSYYIAVTSLELFLVYKNDVNMPTIVKHNFGNVGVVITGLINGALMYALLSVYISGGSDLLSKTVLPLIGIHESVTISLVIFVILAFIIFLKGVDLVVKSNEIIFTIKLISFLIIIFVGVIFLSPQLLMIKFEYLKYVPKALPIFFAALWFHFLIPVIARLNNYERVKIRKVFFTGVLIPVILYILWVGIMLSLVPRDGIGNTFFYLLSQEGSLGIMIQYATSNNENLPYLLKASVNLFSNIAMLTSFLTVGISTYDYLRDAFKIKQNSYGILKNVILTLLPPVVFAVLFPNGFILILEQAAILLMLINIFMLICCIKEYNRLQNKPNKLLLFFLISLLGYLISSQILDNMNLLPSFGMN